MSDPDRTAKHVAANKFDLALHRLIGQAEKLADRYKSAHWKDVASLLERSRSRVRLMMHPTDKANTD